MSHILFNTFPLAVNDTDNKFKFIQYPLEPFNNVSNQPIILEADYTGNNNRAYFNQIGDIEFSDSNKPIWSFSYGGERSGKPYLVMDSNRIYPNLIPSWNTSGSHGSVTDVTRFGQTFKYITNISSGHQIAGLGNIAPLNTEFCMSQVIKKIRGVSADLQAGFMVDIINDALVYQQIRVNYKGELVFDSTGKVLDQGSIPLGDDFYLIYVYIGALNNTSLGGLRVGYSMNQNDIEIGMINVNTFLTNKARTIPYNIHNTIPYNTTTDNPMQISLTNLLSNNVTSVNGFSMRVRFKKIKNGGINGDGTMVFLNSSNQAIFSLWTLSEIAPYDNTAGAYMSVNVRSSDFVITFDGQNFKMFDNTGKIIDYNLSTSGHQIDRFAINSGDNYFEIADGPMFYPNVLSEADALKALTITDIEKYSHNKDYKYIRESKIINDGLFIHLDASNPNCFPDTGNSKVHNLGNALVRGDIMGGTLRHGTDESPHFKYNGSAYIKYNNLNFDSPHITVCFWAKITTNTGLNYAFDTQGSRECIFKWQDNDITRIQWGLGSGTYPIYTQGSYLNQYVFYAMTYDGTTEKLYINNVLSDSFLSSTDPIIDFNELWVGTYFGIGGYTMTGNLNDFMIYDIALTQEQIVENYNATRYKYGNY